MPITTEAGSKAPGGITASDIIARIERLPYGAWHTWIRVVVGITILFDSLDGVAMASVMPVLTGLWKITPSEAGTLIAANFIGGAVGAVVAGWLADRYGRMRLMMVSIALFAVMSVFCAFAWDFRSLFIFRTIEGLGLGAEVPIAATFINEWAKAQGRARYFLLYSTIFMFGGLVGSLLGVWVVPNFGWRWMFYIGALPALVVGFLRYFIPESPRWLVSKGRIEEADRIVARVERSLSKAGKLPLPPVHPVAVTEPGKKTRFAELFHGLYRRRTIMLWILSFSTAFVELGTTNWMATIFRIVFKLSVRTSLTYGMLTLSVVVLSGIISAFLIDWSGRKVWFSVCMIVGSVPYFCVWHIKPLSPEIFLLWIMVATMFLASTLNLTVLYMTEVYPTRMRALGSSVSRIWYGAAAISGPIAVGVIIQKFGLWPVPIVMGSVAIVAGVLTAVFAVETKGRTLEEIAP